MIKGNTDMSYKLHSRLGAGAASLAAATLTPIAAYAQDAAEAAAPVVDKGDTAWMMVSTLLVLFMIIPGLALFYGGLVRAKNMLSVLMQCTLVASVVMIIWVLWGYSFAFGGSTSPYWGGIGKVFLSGVNMDSTVATFTDGVALPEYVFICFQMTFAAITPALIVGAFAERAKFTGVILFTVLWVTFVYFPIAHMVWDGAGLIFNWGAIDFAGGTEVQLRFGGDITSAKVRETLQSIGHDGADVVAVEDSPNEYIIRVREVSSLSEEKIASIEANLTRTLGEDLVREVRVSPGGDKVTLRLAQDVEHQQIVDVLEGEGARVRGEITSLPGTDDVRQFYRRFDAVRRGDEDAILPRVGDLGEPVIEAAVAALASANGDAVVFTHEGHEHFVRRSAIGQPDQDLSVVVVVRSD